MEKQIFDPLRKKPVSLTPEENVRQVFIKWLHENKKYPLGLMSSEYSLKFGKRNFRCDIIVFNRRIQPLMIVECKSPDVKITQKTIEQILKYNIVLRVKYLVITNGVVTFASEFDEKTGSYFYISDIPEYVPE